MLLHLSEAIMAARPGYLSAACLMQFGAVCRVIEDHRRIGTLTVWWR
ncbi:hypothetical protein SAMN05660380_00504 [Xylella fastidiosa]|jgi:hypothetical protein|uniref:Uncharacterized protein n=1 Tax=Xylella fastidiosa subsp. sandyi Ann-1 TaxID=155920 RepID=A0A060HCC8_XYLFS|nr:hypothetical protein [Xylella fastidiosa]AIC11031.1 hypothetical protein D934_03050 [Xylella fastidiosa subsp. sandyi Ann-1]SHG37047.1 hypothetical protein SAMN05660380_00504 [Xylella fastidiosa]